MCVWSSSWLRFLILITWCLSTHLGSEQKKHFQLKVSGVCVGGTFSNEIILDGRTIALE